MPFVSEIDHLKIVYKEIIDGYSWFDEHKLYVKHLDELENIEVTRYKLSVFNDYVKQGIPSTEEKLKSLISSQQWSEAKEEQILTYKYHISDNEKNFKNIIPQQQPMIRKAIDETKGKLNTLLMEKNKALGTTADSFAERSSFNYMIYLSIYDKDFKKMFSSYDVFEELTDDSDVLLYGSLVEKTLTNISHKLITQIAVMPFFLNNLSYSKDNIYYFLDRPVVRLSHYQAALLSLGTRNLNVLSNTDTEPPELMDDVKLDDIVFWYDKSYSVMLGKAKSPR